MLLMHASYFLNSHHCRLATTVLLNMLLQAASVTNKTLDAFKHAQDSLKSENIIFSSANVNNPGIPPSSLMSFLRKVIPAVHLRFLVFISNVGIISSFNFHFSA